MKFFKKIKNKYEIAKAAAESQMFWDSLPRQIAPAVIEEFPEYIRINHKTLARCVLVGVPPSSDISGYPADMNPRVIDELLGTSVEGHAIAYSLTAIPIPNVKAMKMLDEAIFKNRVSQESYRDHKSKGGRIDRNQQPPMKKILEEEDFAANYRQIFKNEQKMYHTAFIIIIWGKSDKELREAESHITVILEANRIYYEFPDYRQLDAFIAAQPYPFWADFTWVELFSYHTATLTATRNPNSRTDETGLYFGDDIRTGKSIQIDLKNLAAQHLMLVGPTGSGKTFTLLMLLMRAYDMLGKRVIYTTPKSDITTNYRAVAEYYGKSASIIDIGPKGKNINPLQILSDKKALGNYDESYKRAFDEHMELLDQFFSVLFEGTKSPNQTNYLNETLIEVYKRKGIVRENPETWKNADWPTLLDLRQIWLEDAKDSKDVTAQALVDKTFMINTAWSYMNRPTDINLSADFIIIDISDVPASIQDAMNVFVTGIMGMRFKTDTKRETIIAVDEAAVFLRHPKLGLFLLRTLTQGRSYNISLWLSTQQTVDLIKANVEEEFKTNISISIILGNMRKDTLDHVKMFYKLNEANTTDLIACGVGEGLLLVGNEVIPTRFKPTEHEMAVLKGRGKKPGQKPVSDIGLKLVMESLSDLAAKHGIYFDDWIEGDSTILSRLGFEHRTVQRAISRGTQRAWIKSDLLIGDMIGNQSIDHYCTVLQLAGYLQQQGVIPQINHYEDVDILIELGTEKIAFEYERPGSHTLSELVKKKQEFETKYNKVFFIGTAENIKLLSEAVGSDCAIRRGSQLSEFITDLIEQYEPKIVKLEPT